jgi:hypothetical protein
MLFSNYDYTVSNEGVINEWRNEKDLEGSDQGLILRYYPGIRMGELKKTTKPSVRIASLRVEIWTRDLPNTKQKGSFYQSQVLQIYYHIDFHNHKQKYKRIK